MSVIAWMVLGLIAGVIAKSLSGGRAKHGVIVTIVIAMCGIGWIAAGRRMFAGGLGHRPVVRVVWWSSALDLGVLSVDRRGIPVAHLDPIVGIASVRTCTGPHRSRVVAILFTTGQGGCGTAEAGSF